MGGFFTRLIDLDVWTVLLWRGVFGGLTVLAFIGSQHQRQTRPLRPWRAS
jgi:hypothetical protein